LTFVASQHKMCPGIAGVAESADALDSKSSLVHPKCGFESHLRQYVLMAETSRIPASTMTTRWSAGTLAGTSRRAVVLVSGGLDSATTLAIARSQGFECAAIAFDYGQRHRWELHAAARVAAHLGIAPPIVVPIDLRAFGGSALTAEIDVPKGRSPDDMAAGIPITYVPARNTIFLSLALGYAESLGVRDLFIGVNAVDYSGYPDCRPEYLTAFTAMANLATKAGVEGQPWTIHAPLIAMTKGEIIRRGVALGVDYGLTHSCYDPDDHGRACGQCDSCQLRLHGFAEAGLTDPAMYQ
jgi:7-cyano-7-deazaguanine synthase